jgi:hypothetical protein
MKEGEHAMSTSLKAQQLDGKTKSSKRELRKTNGGQIEGPKRTAGSSTVKCEKRTDLVHSHCSLAVGILSYIKDFD